MRLVVDPFVPVQRRTAPVVRRPVQRRGISLDGVRPARPNTPPKRAVQRHWIGPRDPLPSYTTPQPVAPQPLPVRHLSFKPAAPLKQRPPDSRLRRITARLQTPSIIAGGLAVGLLAQSQLLGEVAIGAYGAFAVIRHVRSRTTFLFTLCALLGIVGLLVTTNNDRLATTLAVYVFLLLFIGVVTLGIELYRGEA